jgi:AAA ATPase domain
VRARGVIQSPVLVGRDAYLALVENRLAGAAEGAGQLLFVAGEAGIGKTRLLRSAARRAQASGFTVARGAAFPGDVQSLAGRRSTSAATASRCTSRSSSRPSMRAP